jgi:hypothetical protein
MAINRVQEPANPPTAIGDWTKIIAEMRAVALGIEMPLRVIGSNIVKGAVFQIGGTLYLADADTAISGSASNYVKITPSGDGSVCTAAFVSSLTGVTWNSTYCGWYDSGSPASFYEFDEGKAFTAGQIAAIRRNRDVTIPMGTGWLAVLASAIAAGWSTAFGSALGANWSTALAAEAGAGILARLLTVDGTGSGLDADKLDGLHAGHGDGEIPVNGGGTVNTNLYAATANNAFYCREYGVLKKIYGSKTGDEIHDYFAGFLSVSEEIGVSGMITSGGNNLVIAYAERTSSSRITLYGINSGTGNLAQFYCDDGSATNYYVALTTRHYAGGPW